MGFSWSLFFAEDVVSSLVGAVSALAGVEAITDRSWDLTVGKRVRYVVYVDNVIVMGP